MTTSNQPCTNNDDDFFVVFAPLAHHFFPDGGPPPPPEIGIGPSTSTITSTTAASAVWPIQRHRTPIPPRHAIEAMPFLLELARQHGLTSWQLWALTRVADVMLPPRRQHKQQQHQQQQQQQQHHSAAIQTNTLLQAKQTNPRVSTPLVDGTSTHYRALLRSLLPRILRINNNHNNNNNKNNNTFRDTTVLPLPVMDILLSHLTHPLLDDAGISALLRFFTLCAAADEWGNQNRMERDHSKETHVNDNVNDDSNNNNNNHHHHYTTSSMGPRIRALAATALNCALRLRHSSPRPFTTITVTTTTNLQPCTTTMEHDAVRLLLVLLSNASVTADLSHLFCPYSTRRRIQLCLQRQNHPRRNDNETPPLMTLLQVFHQIQRRRDHPNAVSLSSSSWSHEDQMDPLTQQLPSWCFDWDDQWQADFCQGGTRNKPDDHGHRRYDYDDDYLPQQRPTPDQCLRRLQWTILSPSFVPHSSLASEIVLLTNSDGSTDQVTDMSQRRDPRHSFGSFNTVYRTDDDDKALLPIVLRDAWYRPHVVPLGVNQEAVGELDQRIQTKRRRLLQILLKWSERTGQLPILAQTFIMDHVIPVWDGSWEDHSSSWASLLLEIVPYLSPITFSEWSRRVLRHLQPLFLYGTPSLQIAMMASWGKLVHRWGNEYRQDPNYVSMDQTLRDIVNWTDQLLLCAFLLNPSEQLRTATLDFFESVCHLTRHEKETATSAGAETTRNKTLAAPFLPAPSLALCLRLLLSPIALHIDRLCQLLADYQESYRRLRQESCLTDDHQSSEKVDDFHALIGDICNLLWRGSITFTSEDAKTSKLVASLREETRAGLAGAGDPIRLAWSLTHGAAFVHYSRQFLKVYVADSSSPHPDEIAGPLKVRYLDYLREECGLTGIYNFLVTFISSLHTHRHDQGAEEGLGSPE